MAGAYPFRKVAQALLGARGPDLLRALAAASARNEGAVAAMNGSRAALLAADVAETELLRVRQVVRAALAPGAASAHTEPLLQLAALVREED